jgi:hypothetical protein
MKTIALSIAGLMLMMAGPVFGEQTQSGAAAGTPDARINAAMAAAARAQIPVSLLQNKVAEGEAKNVPRERIATAVESRLSGLVRASGVLRAAELNAYSAGELGLMSDALEAGVSESVAIRTMRSAPEERRVVAIAVVTDLVRLGHGSEPAFVRVNSSLSTNTALANLQAEVATQLRLSGLNSTLEANGLLRLP